MTAKDNLCEMPFVWLAARCARLGDSATDNAVEAKAQQFAEEWAGLVMREMPLPDYKITNELEEDEAVLRVSQSCLNQYF